MTASIVRPIAVLSIDYPEGPIADAIEAEVQQSLPPVSGLEGARTENERSEAYSRAIDAQRDATAVTWAMFGPRPFALKLMGLFFSMDRMIGRDFEVGLANLKSTTETQ